MKSLVFFTCFLNTAGSVYYCNVTDPCGQANSTEFFESYARFENCQHDAAYRFCDRYIAPQWYRVNEAMLTQCPQLLSCGTLYPVWLNGTLPGSSDGIVDRKACKVGFESCCVRSYNIKIKHCGSFYAYCLAALDSCPERYCFGKTGDCDIPTSAAPVTTTTKMQTIPPLSTSCAEDPCIESNLRILSDPGTRSMHCEYKQGDGHCDNSLTPGWYKTDFPMLTQCPGLLSCGAIYPVWMNGTNPGQGEGVVTRQVCQRGFTGCCSTSYDIKVKNCGSYTAYCLRQLSTCPARYCFDNERCFDDKKKDSDNNDNKEHSHLSLEIMLGVFLGVLLLVLVVLVISNVKRYNKGHGKTGSVVNIQKSNGDRVMTLVNPAYTSESGNPPPYTP